MDYSTVFMIRAFLARCFCKFLSEGCIKAYGVILENFVGVYKTYYFLVGWSFTIQVGVCFIVAPVVQLLRGKLRCDVLCILGGILSGLGYLGHSVIPVLGIWQLFLYSLITGLGFGLCNTVTVFFLKEAFQMSFSIAYATSLLSAYIGIAVLPLLSDYLLHTYGEVIDMAVFSALCFALVLVGLMMSNAEDENVQSEKLQEALEGTEDTEGGGEFTKGQQVIKYVNLDNGNLTSENVNLLPKSKENVTNRKIKKSKNLESSSRENKESLHHSLFKDHPYFILNFAVCALFGYNFSSWSIFLVPLGEFTGLESSTAVWMSTCGGLGGITGNIYSFIMIYVDLIDEINGLILPTALIALSFTVTWISTSFTSMAVYSFLSGFGIAAQGVLTTSLLPRYICDDHFDTAVAVMYLALGSMNQIGGIVTGGIMDVTGSYFYSFGLMSLLNLIISIGGLTFLIYLKCRKI